LVSMLLKRARLAFALWLYFYKGCETMQIIRSAEMTFPRDTVVTIGNLDGVHRGHQRLIQEVKRIALINGMLSVVLTFDPHPLLVLRGTEPPVLLSNEEKCAVLETFDIDYVVEYPFTQEFAQWTPERFFQDLLVSIRCKRLVIGEDFRFGQNGMGDAALAASLGAAQGVRVHTLPDITENGERISSSHIRTLIQNRAFAAASNLMGRSYTIAGVVSEVTQHGRKGGFPSIQLVPHTQKLLPPDGVYLSEALWRGKTYESVTNIGSGQKPNGQERIVETHIIDSDQPMFGETLEIHPLGFLRGEQPFASSAELRAAIMADVASARRFFGRSAEVRK